jgi:hypothetical protein
MRLGVKSTPRAAVAETAAARMSENATTTVRGASSATELGDSNPSAPSATTTAAHAGRQVISQQITQSMPGSDTQKVKRSASTMFKLSAADTTALSELPEASASPAKTNPTKSVENKSEDNDIGGITPTRQAKSARSLGGGPINRWEAIHGPEVSDDALHLLFDQTIEDAVAAIGLDSGYTTAIVRKARYLQKRRDAKAEAA